MRIRIAAFLIGSAIAMEIVWGQSPTSIKKVPLEPTSAASGKEMFAHYCAVCHGPDGRGNGPAASALKTLPADLTQLATRANGKFPKEHVTTILSGMGNVSAHGSAEMPVWGELFRDLGNGDEQRAILRIANLTSYVKSMQAK